jgi:hypothetical protein
MAYQFTNLQPLSWPRKFLSIYKSQAQPAASGLRPDQFSPVDTFTVSLRYILILSFHQHQGLLSFLLLEFIQAKIFM